MIELVVVVTIVSVLSLSFVLGVGGGSLFSPSHTDLPARQVEVLQRTVQSLRDRALLSRQGVGLIPMLDGWVVVQRDPALAGWRELTRHSGASALSWTIGGRPHQPQSFTSSDPELRFLSDGRSTSFRVRFGSSPHTIDCVTDGTRPLLCQSN